METIETERLILRPFRESDYADLFEFLYQLRDDEFEGRPIWKDTYVYAKLNDEDERTGAAVARPAASVWISGGHPKERKRI